VIALMVAIGAAVGAPLRYLIDRGIQARYKTVFPWGTLIANVSACFALGLVTGTVTATSPSQVQALIGTGLAGALSTLSYQTLRLAEEGFRTFATVYVLVTLAAGPLAATAGVALGHVAWAWPGTPTRRSRTFGVHREATPWGA
jgi:fluoride exporter